MPNERERQQGLETRRTGAFLYIFFFIFSIYFISGWPPHLHSTTTTSTTTSNHDYHDKGLETMRLDPQVCFFIYSFLYSLLILSQDGHHIFTRQPLPLQPPPTTIIMTKGSRQRVQVSTHRCVFLFIPLYIFLYLFYLRTAATSSLDHHYLHNHLQ